MESYANQVWDYLQLGMEAEARTYLQGILLGLYRFDAHVYMANWGTPVCMINLPLKAISTFLIVIVLMACLGYLECSKGALDYG